MRKSLRSDADVTKPNHAVLFAATALVATLSMMTMVTHAADAFAPVGTKATLNVDYIYESSGAKRSEGMYDPYEWRVKRTVNLSVELTAQTATAMPTVQAIDASQRAELQSTSDKAQAVSTQMAPMVADVEKIMAKCGEDEACIASAVQRMGATMQGTPGMTVAMGAKDDAQALANPGAPRYQAWRPTAQKGSYLIDEVVHISVTDPICTSLPHHRCTRDEVRKGTGEVPVPAEAKKDKGATTGVSAVEMDGSKNTLTVALPVPMFPLRYTETITTDEPEGTHDTPTPTGPHQKLLRFRVDEAGAVTHAKPLTVSLKGDWRSQTGERVVPLTGEFGDAGTLTIRWRFSAQ